MDDRTVIYEEGEYRLVRTESFRPDVIELFNRTIWGSEGALYEHKQAEDNLARIGDPVLVELRMGEKLAGTCLFIRRKVCAGEIEFYAQYVRYLMIHPDYRNRGLMKKSAALTMKIVRELEERPAAFVGIVEKKNKRSYHIVSGVDYHPVSTIRTLSFSRFFPRSDVRMESIRPEEHIRMRTLLESRYAGYSFWHTENLFLDDHYYVIRENGEIVAGLQAFRGHWVVRNLPGRTGRLMVRLLPHIPLLRRIFNPADFNFAAFDYIYYKDGHIRDLISLFSSVLQKMGLYSALYWQDGKSPMVMEILQQRLGPFQRFSHGNDAYLMVGFENLDEGRVGAISRMPAFQSAGDFI